MFHGKFVAIEQVQHVAKTQTIIADVNVVDVNVTTRSNATEEHVFKDREPRKANNATNWEKEEWLKNSMVETIQQIQKNKPRQWGHPHAWRDGTQHGQVCQIILLWKHIDLRK